MSHLLPIDKILMQEFLDANPGRYASIEFDVHVGQGSDPGPDYDSKIQDMAIRLSQRRIDAVGFLPQSIEIIEVTQHADIKALGQLHCYPKLYQETFHPKLPLQAVLVARTIGTDLDQIYDTSFVDVYLFP